MNQSRQKKKIVLLKKKEKTARVTQIEFPEQVFWVVKSEFNIFFAFLFPAFFVVFLRIIASRLSKNWVVLSSTSNMRDLKVT